jgi:hypothetical protein
MCDAGPDDARLLPKLSAGTAQPCADLSEAGAADVAQLDMFQRPPYSFLRVEFGRIAGEAFEVQPVAGFLMQELLDGAAALDQRAVLEHGQLAWHMTQQIAGLQQWVRPIGIPQRSPRTTCFLALLDGKPRKKPFQRLL